VDNATLADTYASMETAELSSLHQSGTISEEAYPVLESELSRRGVPVLGRPPVSVAPPELPFFSAHWNGRHSSQSAVLLVAAVVPALMGLVFYGAVQVARLVFPAANVAAVLSLTFAVVTLAYAVFAAVAVWRCSRNGTTTLSKWWVRWRGLGLVASIVLVAALALSCAIHQLSGEL